MPGIFQPPVFRLGLANFKKFLLLLDRESFEMHIGKQSLVVTKQYDLYFRVENFDCRNSIT